jgi:hypothetical protein
VSLWPAAIELDDVAIPLGELVADLVLHRGRDSVSSEPTADTLQVTIHDVARDFVRAFDVGQSLRLTVSDGGAPAVPRFAGRVTDARLDDDQLTVIGTGPIATFRELAIGASSWPAESWSARVLRAFTEAGLAASLDLRPDPELDPILAPRDSETAGATTLGDYVAFLAPMIGALVADQPDGTTLVQAIGARTLDAAIELEPGDVAYAPVWEEQLPSGNIVTVRYQGDQGASVTVQDDASIEHYGRRPITIDTTFQAEADATARARSALNRSAYSHWEIAGAPLLRGLDLPLGEAVILSGLPGWAPFEPWTPLVEGWTDTISGSSWRMELALSDPLVSGLTLSWESIPIDPLYLWSTIDPATAWADALTLDDLEAA